MHDSYILVISYFSSSISYVCTKALKLAAAYDVCVY